MSKARLRPQPRPQRHRRAQAKPLRQRPKSGDWQAPSLSPRSRPPSNWFPKGRPRQTRRPPPVHKPPSFPTANGTRPDEQRPLRVLKLTRAAGRRSAAPPAAAAEARPADNTAASSATPTTSETLDGEQPIRRTAATEASLPDIPSASSIAPVPPASADPVPADANQQAVRRTAEASPAPAPGLPELIPEPSPATASDVEVTSSTRPSTTESTTTDLSAPEIAAGSPTASLPVTPSAPAVSQPSTTNDSSAAPIRRQSVQAEPAPATTNVRRSADVAAEGTARSSGTCRIDRKRRRHSCRQLRYSGIGTATNAALRRRSDLGCAAQQCPKAPGGSAHGHCYSGRGLDCPWICPPARYAGKSARSLRHRAWQNLWFRRTHLCPPPCQRARQNPSLVRPSLRRRRSKLGHRYSAPLPPPRRHRDNRKPERLLRRRQVTCLSAQSLRTPQSVGWRPPPLLQKLRPNQPQRRCRCPVRPGRKFQLQKPHPCPCRADVGSPEATPAPAPNVARATTESASVAQRVSVAPPAAASPAGIRTTPHEAAPIARTADAPAANDPVASSAEPAVQRAIAMPIEVRPSQEPTAASISAAKSPSTPADAPAVPQAGNADVVRRSAVAEAPPSSSSTSGLASSLSTGVALNEAPALASAISSQSPISAPARTSPAPRIEAASPATVQRATAAALPPPPPLPPTVVHAATPAAIQRESVPSNATGAISGFGGDEPTTPEKLDVRKLAEEIWPLFYRKLRTERERERGLT